MLVLGLLIVAIALVLCGWVVGHFAGSRKERTTQ